jgi:hypothetical protein
MMPGVERKRKESHMITELFGRRGRRNNGNHRNGNGNNRNGNGKNGRRNHVNHNRRHRNNG